MRKLLVILLAVSAIGAAGYLLWQGRQTQQAAREAVQQEREAWQQRTEKLEEKIGMLEKEIREQPAVDSRRMTEAFGREPAAGRGGAPLRTEERISNFFAHLDRQGYLQRHGVTLGSREYVRRIIGRLDASRPVVSGETQDLYTLLKNITYFFRVLGKQDVAIIREIVAGEGDIIEPTAELLFRWLDPWDPAGGPDRPAVRPETFYEYAGFFLDTIAGQSYLFRRDSRVRCLVSYYCIIVLDRANKDGLNRHGIDIMPHVQSLMSDIASHRRLSGRAAYLKTLGDITR